MNTKQVQEQNAQYQAEKDARFKRIMEADYSAATTLEELWYGLSAEEIKILGRENATFKKKQAEIDAAPLPQTQTLAPSQDEIDAGREAERVAAEEAEATRVAAEAAEAQTPEEQAAAIQAEADRVAAEAAAANVTITVPRNQVEVLYDGVEKLGEGSYKLTVDPGDGTPAEVFFGSTQADLFKALRKSKASATKELRRRAKKVQITDELRALAVEVINYPPLVKPLYLTPDEIFTLTEQQKDPVTVLEATRKLRMASVTQEDCDRQNEAIERQRFSDGRNTAMTWLQSRPDFYNCTENIEAFQKLMGDLNWAVTMKNMDLAYDILVEQGVLLERPEEPTSDQPAGVVPAPVAQPASVVPVVTVPVVAASAAVVPAVTPSAPAGALPAANKVLRPASNSTAIAPTRRIDSVATAPVVRSLTAEDYNNMSAETVKRRYGREPEFKAAVDALIATGKI